MYHPEAKTTSQTMEKVNLNYSKKNIPIPTNDSYLKCMLHQFENLVKRMRWKVFFFENPNSEKQKETFGFKSTSTAPPNEKLHQFEQSMYELISTLEFDRSPNPFQRKMQADLKNLRQCKDLLVSADKTTNMYKLPVDAYTKLLSENITQTYKKADPVIAKSINKEAKEIATKLDLQDRIEVIAARPAYITLKDHKENFRRNPKCRLINPAKSEIGIISKNQLEVINTKLRSKTGTNQWRNTAGVIDWFRNLEEKPKSKFMKFDITDFYPSITFELFSTALDYASQFFTISQEVKDIILHSRKSLLFNGGETWVKQQGENFDVTQGSYDGAEVCELVGVYILSKLDSVFGRSKVGLYRDDGLACCANKSGPQLERTRKKVVQIFKDIGLKITVELGLTCTDFLDVTLDLEKNLYSPYRKPNDEPLYIHIQSNHPPSIRKQLPSMIEERLSAISSNEETFNKAKPVYEEALRKSGYSENLNFNMERKPVKKNRRRNIIWFNPPYSSNVKINIGRKFIDLVSTHFPKHHRYHKLFNKNNMKLSYRTMPNMESIITKHNRKLLSSMESVNNERTCNCRNKVTCPLQGNCLAKSVIYKATVISDNEEKFYLGCCESEFKLRFNNHTQSFKSKTHMHDTQLSKYVWSLKETKTDFNIVWSIAAKASPYACGTRKCDLCLTEKLLIAKSDPGKMLNSRAEIFSKCRHQNKFKLKCFKT